MNVFILAKNPTVSAKYHVDKHVVKMPLETAQMLCAVLYRLKYPKRYIPYKKTHPHHPCTEWAYSSYKNYLHLCTIGLALCREYTYRYKKVHACEEIIRYCRDVAKSIKDRFSQHAPTTPAQAMPDECKHRNTVRAYRTYYMQEKNHLFVWTGRPVPKFINQFN